MAQNITLLGASYSDVPAVTLPKTGGGTARFDDASITTATASDVATGKVFLASDGTITTGTNSGGGGGGGSATKKQINFIDYDGTIVDSYTASEWASVTSLPSNPSHTGLTAQGWNWTKAQIDAQLAAMPDDDVWVGQMYITTSGDTEIDVVMYEGRLSPTLSIAVNGTITVDWGDGTTADTVSGSSLATTVNTPQHTYASAGNYTITIHVVSGSFQFHGTSTNYSLLHKYSITSSNENIVYANCIQNVWIGSGVTSIGDNAFRSCQSLASVTIPSSVTSISTYAFQNCYSLASVTMPSGVTSISKNTFSGCFSLASVTIPNGVTSIGNNAFSSCYSLASVTIPNGVTSIGTYVFYYCYSLASVTIPSGVASIGTYAFYYCYSLARVTIPSSVTSIGTYAFYYCQSLASVTIPNGVTSIGTYTFFGCYSLASVTIPSSVTSIGNNAFQNCYSLARVTIPSGVTSIGNNAFRYCCGAAEYHIKPTSVPTLGTNGFGGIASDCIICVPSASLEAYKAATNWSTYASEMQGE